MSAWKTIVRFVVENLPDSVSRRREILNAVVEAMPANHPAAAPVSDLLGHLNRHNLLQRELPTLVGDSLPQGKERPDVR